MGWPVIWWIVGQKATVRVVTDDRGVITEAAPLVRRFIGQPLENVQYWMHKRFGPITTEKREEPSRLDYCIACGAYLAGSWTRHADGCSMSSGKSECPPDLEAFFDAKARK